MVLQRICPQPAGAMHALPFTCAIFHPICNTKGYSIKSGGTRAVASADVSMDDPL